MQRLRLLFPWRARLVRACHLQKARVQQAYMERARGRVLHQNLQRGRPQKSDMLGARLRQANLEWVPRRVLQQGLPCEVAGARVTGSAREVCRHTEPIQQQMGPLQLWATAGHPQHLVRGRPEACPKARGLLREDRGREVPWPGHEPGQQAAPLPQGGDKVLRDVPGHALQGQVVRGVWHHKAGLPAPEDRRCRADLWEGDLFQSRAVLRFDLERGEAFQVAHESDFPLQRRLRRPLHEQHQGALAQRNTFARRSLDNGESVRQRARRL